MNPSATFPPLAVIVPAQTGRNDAIVSRPLANSRTRATGAMPWLALAFGVTGGQWYLAPRQGATPENIDFAIRYAMGGAAKLVYAWEVAEETGLFRKSPSLLRGHINAPYEAITPNLMWDLTSTLLLSTEAMCDAANKLGSPHLLVGVLGRNELLVAPARDGDVTAARGFFKKIGPKAPDSLFGDLVFHLQVTRFEEGMIVGISGRDGDNPYYSNAAMDVHSWEIESAPPQASAAPVLRLNLDDYQTELLRVVQGRGGAPIDFRMLSMMVQGPRGKPFESLWEQMAHLEQWGLVVGHRGATGRAGAWSVTQPGDAIIRALKEVEVVPTDEEKLIADIECGAGLSVHVPRSLLATPERLGEIVMGCLAKEPYASPSVLAAIGQMEKGFSQDQLRARVFADPRPEVAWAYVGSIHPGKVDKPARHKVREPPELLAAALETTLRAPDPMNHARAGKVAYATGVVDPLVPLFLSAIRLGRDYPYSVSPTALLTPESPPEESPMEAVFWATLNLGCTTDPRSYPVLLDALGAPNEVIAVAAAIAVSLRTDTREVWFELLDGGRPVLRAATIYSLLKIVTGLSDNEVERLRAHPAADVAEAVRKYTLRRGRKPA